METQPSAIFVPRLLLLFVPINIAFLRIIVPSESVNVRAGEKCWTLTSWWASSQNGLQKLSGLDSAADPACGCWAGARRAVCEAVESKSSLSKNPPWPSGVERATPDFVAQDRS